MVALALVLGGTAVAATQLTYLTKRTGTRLVKHLAPTLTVKAAKTAYSPGALASGKTVYGTIGSQPPETGIGSGDEVGDTASLPFPAPVALDNAHVSVDGIDDDSGECTGTAAAPTAAPGYACIYVYASENATVNGGYIWSTQTSKYGFQMSWDSTAGGYSFVFANWAYTAP